VITANRAAGKQKGVPDHVHFEPPGFFNLNKARDLRLVCELCG
jgi:hypothetical protein